MEEEQTYVEVADSTDSMSRGASLRRDFSAVVAALDRYIRASGRDALKLSGWEVEDARLGPPQPLLARLTAIPARPHDYAYAHDFNTAKSRAAALFAPDITLASESLSPAHVAITQNSTQALLLALAALRERGVEHAVVAAPTYFAAVEACAHLGLPITVVPTADFLTGALDVDAIATAAAGRRSLVLLTNPAYSLGTEYTPAQLDALFDALPAGCWVMLDETRLGLSWRYDAPWYSTVLRDNVVLLRSPSKIFFSNGLKTSLLIAVPSLVRAVERLSEALLGSLPGNAEEVALAYLDAWADWHDEARSGVVGPMLAWKRGIVGRLRTNLHHAREVLAAAGYRLSPIDSGPYVLAGISKGSRRSLDDVSLAALSGVLVMDSSYFYHESDEWSAFRVNLCAGPDRLRAALARTLETL